MAITLELSSSELDDEELQELTQQLCNDLRDETSVDAQLATAPSQSEAKGDLPIWGQIVIATLSSSVLTGFVGVLTAYIQRAKAVTIKLKKDGKEIEVSANNAAEAERLLKKYLLL